MKMDSKSLSEASSLQPKIDSKLRSNSKRWGNGRMMTIWEIRMIFLFPKTKTLNNYLLKDNRIENLRHKRTNGRKLMSKEVTRMRQSQMKMISKVKMKRWATKRSLNLGIVKICNWNPPLIKTTLRNCPIWPTKLWSLLRCSKWFRQFSFSPRLFRTTYLSPN